MSEAAGHDAALERALLERLGGGFAHSLENPLSALRINLTLLREDLAAALPADAGVRRRLELIDAELRRLDAALSGFQRLAAMRAPNKEPRDLGALAGEVAEFVEPGFRRAGIALETRTAPLRATVDAPLVKQALLALLLNAQAASRRGGRVVLATDEAAAVAIVEVADEGCGIAKEDLDRVFEIYFARFPGGAGLGLPTARRIVEDHGGRLALAPRRDGGTRARMELPR